MAWGLTMLMGAIVLCAFSSKAAAS